MDAFALLVAVATIIVTSLGVWYVAWQANVTKDQLELTKQIHHDQAQPYVSCDICADPQQATLLVLVLRNTGPTVATDIRATFDPPIKLDAQMPRGSDVDEWTVSALPPGAALTRVLGFGPRFFEANPDTTRVHVQVTARGLDRERLPPLVYDIDLAALKQTAANTQSVRDVVEAIEKLAKEAGGIASGLRTHTAKTAPDLRGRHRPWRASSSAERPTWVRREVRVVHITPLSSEWTELVAGSHSIEDGLAAVSTPLPPGDEQS